ncbi:MAG: NAD(P)H-dependent glycerol-3-phosphate dehydrogenase [Burkholderiaceae bacterium]|nr:NAD(P)H-dependent glycerol-3-phosphate dehydrogenase [Burkholderiaceae bacterium]
MNITILGAGAWGTAMAITLAARHDVLLWGRFEAEMRPLIDRHENEFFLPGFKLPENLRLSFDFDEAIAHVAGSSAEPALLITATPVAGLRPLAQRLKGKPIPNLIWLCKGFEENTGKLPHQIVAEELGNSIPTGVLSGPSFAQEVAAGMPCALTVASGSAELCQLTVAAVHGGTLRVYSSDDVIGVEVGGAVKNILAIAAGVADGLELGLNARAALLTRGLAEITRLGLALGGRTETFMGLTGAGDLILTCTGNLSRNRTVGLELAKGKTLATIVNELGHVAEGVNCARAVCELAAQKGVDMPIANAVSGVLFGGIAPREMVARLLARTSKEESA